jgi:hypothetical protein
MPLEFLPAFVPFGSFLILQMQYFMPDAIAAVLFLSD